MIWAENVSEMECEIVKGRNAPKKRVSFALHASERVEPHKRGKYGAAQRSKQMMRWCERRDNKAKQTQVNSALSMEFSVRLESEERTEPTKVYLFRGSASSSRSTFGGMLAIHRWCCLFSLLSVAGSAVVLGGEDEKQPTCTLGWKKK